VYPSTHLSTLLPTVCTAEPSVVQAAGYWLHVSHTLWACMQLDDTSETTMAKRAALREKAAAELVNIDDEERAKRKLIGAGAGVVALVAAVGLSVGGVTNPLIRGAVMYLVRAAHTARCPCACGRETTLSLMLRMPGVLVA
jgi:hypothetical protein